MTDKQTKRNTTKEIKMSTINKLKKLGDGVFIYCHNCESQSKLMDFNKNMILCRYMCEKCEMHIQSFEVDEQQQKFTNWLYNGNYLGKSFLGRYLNIPTKFDKNMNLLEDIGLLFFHLLKSNSNIDRCVALINFSKLRGLKFEFVSILMDIADSLFNTPNYNFDTADIMSRMDFIPQVEETAFSTLRQHLNNYERIKELAIFKKLHKFFTYLLCTGFLKNTNISFRSLGFDKFEEECMKRQHKPGMDMIHCLLDTIIFVCECGYDYFKTGNLDSFTHSGATYENWYKQANKLKMQSKYLSNPEPHGFNRFSFVSELKDAIEQGKAIIKYTGGLDKNEKLILQKILCDLQLLEAEETTKRSAQQPRKDPFGILIHGSSHIAKSKLTEIMFKHYGKCFDLPTDDIYRYTRCPTDEYWSGFDSTQWCIIMDDIAFLAPNGEVDPTLKELLQVKNSVPYTPPQAALEDKGRTPVRAELLIATTNTLHLNLQAYFACPFAIARRLSYVVTPTVKPQYVKNDFMIDSRKIPPTEEGDYMDVWNFTVRVPMPESDVAVDNQRTRYVEIEHFEDIHSFLQWFILMAEDHNNSQEKANKAAKTMQDVKVCMKCKRAQKHCLCNTEWAHPYQRCAMCDRLKTNCSCEFEEQVDVSDMNTMYQLRLWLYNKIVEGSLNEIYEISDLTYVYWLYVAYIMCLLYFPFMTVFLSILVFVCKYVYIYFFIICQYYFQWYYGVTWKYTMLFSVCGNQYDTYRMIFRCAGERVKNIKIQKNKLYTLAAILSIPATLFLLKKLWDMYFRTDSHCNKKEFIDQVNLGSIPEALKSEKKTFYYHDPYATTPLEISGASKCAQGNNLINIIKQNTAVFNLKFPSIGRGCYTTAVNFHGNLWMLNKHSIKCEQGEIDIILDDTSKNVSRNVTGVAFNSKDIHFIEDSDVAVIELRSCPVGKSILKYFPIDKPLEGIYKGTYVMKNKCGVESMKTIVNIRLSTCPIFGIPAYIGRVDIPTQVGDCGSLCVAQVGASQVIFGSHTSGSSQGLVSFQHISQTMLNKIIAKFKPQVSEGVIPISAPGYVREIVDLHGRSCLRFIEDGTAKVYGSFSGYRAQHKSKIEPTAICDYVVQHGYKANFGKPRMDWVPWHIAIKDMTKPVHCYLNENIKRCEDAFFNDIISKLGNKIKMLQVYDLDTALNGADGVTYVDKLNASTSAGAPFKKSKKHFIEQIDGKIVKVDDVIMDRVKQIEDCYSNNTRFHPQFCGHLKDEPVSEKKMLSGKTRVFTGGEFAWSIVVRRFLLSHIRLIQNNPFIFEAMPGVVAQSTEWRDLYQFVTYFGEDRIVAGDYGKFDKRMAAPFILSAFNILERLAEKAGWPDEDLRFIRCIAHDTAFPCIDFNGDLIEIQGNPSGHPLTVIINCIVNSLYMRYAYLLISGKEIETFQDNVHLATYGDDNIMGISTECPNFNHTNIAEAMKKIGVEYTMAEKDAESIPYIHISQTSFLKRAFRFDEDVGCIVAPLDESSFHKMLTARLPKDDMASEAHAICVIETAQREYFFYGKEVFEDRQKFFKQLVIDCNLQSWVRDSTFPKYYDLVYDFWMRFDDEENALKYSLREHTRQSRTDESLLDVCGENTLNRFEALSAEELYNR